MSRTVTRTLFILLFVSGSSACTWVELKPEAEAVRITDQVSDTHCTARGSIQVNTSAGIGFIDRSEDTVRQELETLARNEATALKVNHLVLSSEDLEEGRQRYRAYRCQAERPEN